MKSIKNHDDHAFIFDTLQYTKRAISAGFSQKQAEFQAEEMSVLINDTLVTKTVLKQEIVNLERRLQTFHYRMAWTILGGVTTVVTLIQTLSHMVGK